MADLRTDTPATTDQYIARLAENGVTLPLRLCDENLGVLLDADGRDVLTVDSNGVRPDDEVELIAQWIELAVNTCGGFKAVRS